ncbi:hypothetical protein CCMA1212_009837 [Trichoderma ghanense]|uniref:Glycosyltransferase family 32 protein n=1 Tax=Trichoderma ghanense TaxID=65468 RepID=A0ABY2GR02_9HYPO
MWTAQTNVLNYVEESYFPKTPLEGTMDGHKAHMGDLVRLPLLWKYGGVWMDVGLILMRHVDDICWKRIEDPESPYELSAVALMHLPGTYTPLNGFLGTKSSNPFIKRWHDVYLALWADGVTNATGFHEHPLLRHLPLFKPDMSTVNLKDDIRFDPVFFSDYVAHYLCCERIRKLIDPNDGFNGPDWYDKHMLIFDAADEMLYAQVITKWDVDKQDEGGEEAGVAESGGGDFYDWVFGACAAVIELCLSCLTGCCRHCGFAPVKYCGKGRNPSRKDMILITYIEMSVISIGKN